MAQNTNTAPIQFKCPKGKSYIPENNIEQYQFQLKHSLLAHNIEKNPGKYCYINDTKFGEVSGCSNETQKLNYTTTNIIKKYQTIVLVKETLFMTIIMLVNHHIIIWKIH